MRSGEGARHWQAEHVSFVNVCIGECPDEGVQATHGAYGHINSAASPKEASTRALVHMSPADRLASPLTYNEAMYPAVIQEQR